jgi:hypothetical protein
MNRTQASSLARQLMNDNNLNDWKIRLDSSEKSPYLGLCVPAQKCIYLNALAIDQAHETMVKSVILHEIAHALAPNQGHNDVWKNKARELGSTDLEACASYGINPLALDAIRSGHIVEVEIEEETIIRRTPKHTIHKLQDLCPECGKVAKEVSQITTAEKIEIYHYKCISGETSHDFKSELKTNDVKCPTCSMFAFRTGLKDIKEQDVQLTLLSCAHIIKKIIPKATPYQDFITQGHGDLNCKHVFDNPDKPTECTECGALKLYKFQVEGAIAIETGAALNRGFGVFDDMGLGKTIQPLAYLHYHPEKFPFLWIGKSGIKYQYFKEIVKWLGVKHFPQVITSGRDYLLPGMSGYIISYDLLRKFDTSKFEAVGIKTVILDECQAIKNPDATRTSEVRALVKKVETVIPTSGTPWKNRGNEYFVVLNMLDPKKFWSYEDFKRRWVAKYWEGNKEKMGGIRDPEKFKEFIKHIAIRREREIVMPELPRVNRTKFYCEVPDHAKDAYEQAEKKLIDIAKDAAIDGTEDSFKNNAEIMQSLMIMRQIVGMAKVPATLEYCAQFLEECDRKLVVFVHHKSCAAMIHEGLKNMINKKIEEGELNGNAPDLLVLSAELSSEKRMQVQEAFNNSKRAFMVASTLASGEGLNLQTCSDCVMHERQWNPANEEQAEGRFIRIGQMSDKVNAVYVEAENTVDSHLDGIVSRKRIEFHKVMSSNPNAGMITWNEGSIIKELVAGIVASYNNRKKSKQELHSTLDSMTKTLDKMLGPDGGKK